MNFYSQLKTPYITEKTNLIKDAENKFCFKVDKNSNKVEVKKAIEKIFSVKVEKVGILNMQGKKKRLGKNEGKKSKIHLTLGKNKQVQNSKQNVIQIKLYLSP